MAQIGVDELLGDPDLVDCVTIISRTPKINSLGENIVIESPLNSFGCVEPASGKVIQRLPDALRVANISSFWVKGSITVSLPGEYPDVLVFKGRRYQVQTVFDYSNWGAGFSEGTCVVETPS